MQNALVTGGAGFIGSALVRGLLEDPDINRVIVLDNFDTGDSGNLEGLSGEIDVHDVDVRDYKRLEPLFEGVDLVFHEAAIASVPRSIHEPVPVP